MRIKDLPANTSLSSSDVFATDASGGQTKKVTFANLVSQVKSLGGLLGTSDVANNLTTTASGKVLDARQGVELKCLVLDCGTISSLPVTKNNSSITADMVVLQSTLGTPSAQTSDWTVTTAAGSVTISGSISGSTTLTLYLMHSR